MNRAWKKIEFVVSSASMTERLALVFFLITFCASLLAGLVSYQLSKNIIRQSASETAGRATATVASSIDSFLDLADQTAISVYADRNLHIYLNLPPVVLSQTDYQDDIEATVVSALAVNNSVSFINIFGINGFSYTGTYYQGDQTDFTSCNAYYTELGLDAQSARPLWLGNQKVRMNHSSASNMILLVRYIRNIYSYDIIGIMVAGIPESALSKQYMSAGDRPFVIDPQGIILSDTDKDNLQNTWAQEDVLSSLSLSPSGGNVSFYTEDGIRLFASYAKLEKNSWYFINIEDYYAVFRNNYFLLNSILLILFVDILLSFWVVLHISKRMTMKLNHLLDTMKQAQRGDLTVRFAAQGQDDICRIGNYMNQMLNQISYNLAEQEHAKEVQRLSEIRLLQSQINPHLLYNTLDSVHGHLENGHFDMASQILQSMSSFFKLSLSKGEFFLTIERELDLIRYYLNIQRMCRNKDIHFVVTGDPLLMAIKIPKTTFQPIIENSLLHGFDGETTDGQIDMELQRVGEKIEIHITDNGTGLTDDQILALNKNINQVSLSPNTGSYGLWNVNQRLRHCFGRDSGLVIESEFGEYTRVTITMYDRMEPKEDLYVSSYDC